MSLGRMTKQDVCVAKVFTWSLHGVHVMGTKVQCRWQEKTRKWTGDGLNVSLVQTLCEKRALADTLPVVQHDSICCTVANLCTPALDDFVFIGSDGSFPILASVYSGDGVTQLPCVCDGVVEALSALVRHGVNSVADHGDASVVIVPAMSMQARIPLGKAKIPYGCVVGGPFQGALPGVAELLGKFLLLGEALSAGPVLGGLLLF